MSNLADLLEELHLKTVEQLLARVKSGEATSQELNVARQMLKDNGIDSVPTEDNSGLAALAHLTPFDEDDPRSVQ